MTLGMSLFWTLYIRPFSVLDLIREREALKSISKYGATLRSRKILSNNHGLRHVALSNDDAYSVSNAATYILIPIV